VEAFRGIKCSSFWDALVLRLMLEEHGVQVHVPDQGVVLSMVASGELDGIRAAVEQLSSEFPRSGSVIIEGEDRDRSAENGRATALSYDIAEEARAAHRPQHQQARRPPSEAAQRQGAPRPPANAAQRQDAPQLPANAAQRQDAPRPPADAAQRQDAPRPPADAAQRQDAPPRPGDTAQAQKALRPPAGAVQPQDAARLPAGTTQRQDAPPRPGDTAQPQNAPRRPEDEDTAQPQKAVQPPAGAAQPQEARQPPSEAAQSPDTSQPSGAAQPRDAVRPLDDADTDEFAAITAQFAEEAPVAEPAQSQAESRPCSASTAKGRRCRLIAQPGSSTCAVHSKHALSAASPARAMRGPGLLRGVFSRGSRAAPGIVTGGAAWTWSSTRSAGCAPGSPRRPCRSRRGSSAGHRSARTASRPPRPPA